MTVIRLCAKNDTNGNPRRVYVLIGPNGHIKRAVDEGCRGRAALDGIVDTSVSIPDFDTTPAEYRQLLRQFGK